MFTCPNCGKESVSEEQVFCGQCGLNFSGLTGHLTADNVLEDRYVIIKTIGKGGMGAVYLAVDKRLNNSLVAIKEMSSNAVGKGNLQKAIAEFQKEATMLINLRHQALPRIIDFFSQGDYRWYLVMDFIEGETLEAISKNRGAIPEEEVKNWAIQLCEILNYLHSQKPPIIFRDLKPSNIMLTSDGVIKLIDFGIARHFINDSDTDTTSFGSKGYSPPEQYGQSHTDPRSDIYALGATLHHLITGINPLNKLFDFVKPSEVVNVSPAFESIIMRSVELKPEDRPESIKVILKMLREKPLDIDLSSHKDQTVQKPSSLTKTVPLQILPNIPTNTPSETVTRSKKTDDKKLLYIIITSAACAVIITIASGFYFLYTKPNDNKSNTTASSDTVKGNSGTIADNKGDDKKPEGDTSSNLNNNPDNKTETKGTNNGNIVPPNYDKPKIKKEPNTEVTPKTDTPATDQYANEEENITSVVVSHYSNIPSNLDFAYSFFSSRFQRKNNLTNWKKGFVNTVQDNVTSVEVNTFTSKTAEVQFTMTSQDYQNGINIYRDWSGVWKLVKENGEWKLDVPNIKKIKEYQ